MWSQSLIPQIDRNGDPLVGAKAYFYDAGTTTPQVVYADSALGVAIDQPVLADANGRFPAVFLSPDPGSYRNKMTDADDALLFNVDGISVPQDADFVPPDAGDTDPTLLHTTGDVKAMHGTGAQSGWVRANGKTLGNAASGASERANADTSALFQYLWTQDGTLTVSGGRGATAAGDFAANKTIALPNYINRSLAGLLMGGTDPNILASSLVDNSETNDTLGATVGASTHAIAKAELPSYNLTVTDPGHTHTLTDPGHNHNISMTGGSGGGGNPFAGNGSSPTKQTQDATTGITMASQTTGISVASGGSGTAMPVMQPSVLVTFYIKL